MDTVIIATNLQNEDLALTWKDGSRAPLKFSGGSCPLRQFSAKGNHYLHSLGVKGHAFSLHGWQTSHPQPVFKERTLQLSHPQQLRAPRSGAPW